MFEFRLSFEVEQGTSQGQCQEGKARSGSWRNALEQNCKTTR